ncbi:hypothetical protein HOS16_gp54 [Shigella phage vB_SflS-ISF001]|uniref:Uncharacterized protein n=1 Tax=Shigella phage vB_SflS-ISF001 TaxID=2048005 RepID=A0A2D1GQ05_9CAUD|nr:hypothetical protein HOS16_gp54 [Shigella phage vB_SflS-ISF001]ATN94132.1 hypothetical protein FLXISF001_054 [Shigella phage vB_SflS-ISF001]
MKFECVSSNGSGYKWGKIYEGAHVNDESFVVVDEHGSNVNIIRPHENQEIFQPYCGSSKYIFHRIVDGVIFRDVMEAIKQLHNKEVKFLKFECISDITKIFSVGKNYDVPTEQAKHTVALTHDTGRHRIGTVTHNGEGLRWNSAGTKFATFGKNRKRSSRVIGKINTSKISNVKPINVDRKPAMKFEEKADLSGLAIALVLLVASISLMFIM